MGCTETMSAALNARTMSESSRSLALPQVSTVKLADFFSPCQHNKFR